MVKKKEKEKTLEAKETREEKISEDEKRKEEAKALTMQKLDKPLEEKSEEKIEEEVGKLVEAEGIVPEKATKEVKKGARVEKSKSVEKAKAVEKVKVREAKVEAKETEKGEMRVAEMKAGEKKTGEKETPEITEIPETAEIPEMPETPEILETPEIPETPERLVGPKEEEFTLWKPKTELGKLVASGTITSIDDVLKSEKKLLEPEIIDKLVPDLKNELILTGGRKGKGGGKQRIPVKITATMHRSGRRFTTSAFIIVGNEDGLVGIGKASAVESRAAIEKAISRAKMNLIRIKRGCGSWECGCGTEHSIPYKIRGKSGSVRIELMPAPKGVGLVADNCSKILLRLAGVKDVWIKSYGNTKMRLNLMNALFNALKKLYIYER